MRESLNESGVSEVVGTVLLIALVVLGVAVVAAALFSQPKVTEVPHASIVAGENASGHFVLVHEGGDPLSVGEYRIYVGNGTALKDETAHFTAPAGGVWSLGETITYKQSGSPDRVVVTAVTDRGETILAEPDYDGGEDNGTYGGDTGGGDPGLPGVLNADFKANITSGKAPLAVQFIDLSTGSPTAWAWDFGDGVTSTEQYPMHTYTAAGNYTVSLTATNDAGSSETETKTAYITVSASSSGEDTLLNTKEKSEKSGTLLPGGYLEFAVNGTYSDVEINETQYDLVIGDRVKLVIGDDGYGEIYISNTAITTFDYNNVTLYINGIEREKGTVSKIYISSQKDLISTLTLKVPPTSTPIWTKFTVNGNPIINGEDAHGMTLYNLLPRSDGVMNLKNPSQKGVYFIGSISSYTLEEA